MTTVFDGRYEWLWHIHRHHITQRDQDGTPPKMVWTFKGSMAPRPSLRSQKWKSWITWPLTYLVGIRAWLFTGSARSRMECPARICCWLKRPANFTTHELKTSTAFSVTKASTRRASISVNAACTATQGRICWKTQLSWDRPDNR